MYLSQLNMNLESLHTLPVVKHGNDVQDILLTLMQDMAVEESLEETAKFVPVFGSVVATSISYSTTLVVLRRILDEIKHASLQGFDMVNEWPETYRY